MSPRAVLILALSLATSTVGDVLTLTDGTRLDGRLTREGEEWVVTSPAGGVTRVREDRVKSIELTGTRATAGDAGLASLRRATENLPDLGQIITRYEQFIANAAGTPAAAEAARDLGVWKDRRAKGFVKAAGRWMTSADAFAVVMKANEVAARAREALKDGRLQEADALVVEALGVDPQCAAALYLRGIRQLQQNQLPAARRSFEQVNEVVPDHPPTLNNLAITLARQGQVAPAMNAFDQAMLAGPGNPYVLANVAEALNALPNGTRESAPAKRALQHYQEQQATIDAEMAKQGLRRWGSTYVPADELQRLEASDQQNQARAAQIQADQNATAGRIDQIDRDLERIDRAIRAFEIQAMSGDNGGQLPAGYFQIRQDRTRLADERVQLVNRLEAIRNAAKAEQPRAAVPKFTGTLRPIGVEGTPLLVPPTTAPAR